MPANNLTAMLATLTGQLQTNNKDEEQALENLQATIATALVNQDPASISNQQFLFEQSDLFQMANMGGRLEKIESIVAAAQDSLKDEGQQLIQVFERRVPIRTTQLAGSIPPAAAGSRV